MWFYCITAFVLLSSQTIKVSKHKKLSIFFSVWSLHQYLRLTAAKGFGKPDGISTCMWSKDELKIICTHTPEEKRGTLHVKQSSQMIPLEDGFFKQVYSLSISWHKFYCGLQQHFFPSYKLHRPVSIHKFMIWKAAVSAIPIPDVVTWVFTNTWRSLVPSVLQRADLCVTSKQLELLGKNRCTWGPSYWCKDAETAQECGVRDIPLLLVV